MDLSTERKIKFWLSAIVKVLVIALVIFKLIPYLMRERNREEQSESVVKSFSEDSVAHENHTTKPLARPNTPLDKKEGAILKSSSDKVPAEKTVPLSIPVESDKIGIAVYSEKGLDEAVIQQLEATVFKDLNPVAIPMVTDEVQRQKLLTTNFGTMGRQMAKIAVGTTTYHFTQKGNRHSCELRVRINTYDIRKNVKIKEFTGRATSYGIGFSQQQAMQVAIRKLQSLQ